MSPNAAPNPPPKLPPVTPPPDLPGRSGVDPIIRTLARGATGGLTARASANTPKNGPALPLGALIAFVRDPAGVDTKPPQTRTAQGDWFRSARSVQSDFTSPRG